MTQVMPPEPALRPTTFAMQIGNVLRRYQLYRTSAPQRYDYGYVLTLLEDDGTRWILIPPDSADYQIGRYHSGLYWTVPSADFDEDMIAERIWEAINTKFNGPNFE